VRPGRTCPRSPGPGFTLETNRADRRLGGETGRFAVDRSGFVRVADYRLYGLDGVNKVASGEWFEAEDDLSAIEVAKKMMDGHDCELWQGRRFVARIKPRADG
jgi:hypothetical protein